MSGVPETDVTVEVSHQVYGGGSSVQVSSVQYQKVAPSTSTTTTTRFCFCTRGGEHCRNCGGVFVAVCVDCLSPKKENAHWCKKSAHRRSGKGCGRGCLYGGTQKKYGGGYTH